jgi:hypothetical protein
MMKQMVLLMALLLGGTWPGWSETPTDDNAAEPVSFPSGVVARVNQVEVPYDWFLHEFRSTFFQHAGSSDAREAVMKEVVDRMLLYDAALQSGVTNDPAFQARMERQLKDVEAFMRYQLDMARLSMIVEGYLERNPPAKLHELTDREVADFYRREVAGQPGAPRTFEEVPAALQEQIREQADAERRQAILKELVKKLRKGSHIDINEPLMNATPLPEMKGDIPPEFRDAEGPL